MLNKSVIYTNHARDTAQRCYCKRPYCAWAQSARFQRKNNKRRTINVVLNIFQYSIVICLSTRYDHTLWSRLYWTKLWKAKIRCFSFCVCSVYFKPAFASGIGVNNVMAVREECHYDIIIYHKILPAYAQISVGPLIYLSIDSVLRLSVWNLSNKEY